MPQDFDDPKTGTPSSLPGAFRAMVTKEMTARGYTIVKWHEDGLDYKKADQEKPNYMGLSNLLRRVKTAEPTETESIVQHFLANLLDAMDSKDAMPETMEDAAPRLLPRLGQPFAKGQAQPWAKPFPGTPLHINLVIDFPTTMAYVTKDLMEKSDTPPGDWVDVALKNLLELTDPACLDLALEDEGLYCIHTNDSYDASRALILCEMTGNEPAGWLIAVPARDWVFAMKVNNQGIPHFHMMKNLAEKYHEKQPYPISNEIFWVRPGKAWVPFKIEQTDGAIQLYPPEGFMEALGMDDAGEEPSTDSETDGGHA
jgi:hypothetical protein